MEKSTSSTSSSTAGFDSIDALKKRQQLIMFFLRTMVIAAPVIFLAYLLFDSVFPPSKKVAPPAPELKFWQIHLSPDGRKAILTIEPTTMSGLTGVNAIVTRDGGNTWQELSGPPITSLTVDWASERMIAIVPAEAPAESYGVDTTAVDTTAIRDFRQQQGPPVELRKLIQSSDFGLTWSDVPFAVNEDFTSVSIDWSTGRGILLSGASRNYFTNSSGATWGYFPSDFDTTSTESYIMGDFHWPGAVYAVTDQLSIGKFEDVDGQRFTFLSRAEKRSSLRLWDFAIDPTTGKCILLTSNKFGYYRREALQWRYVSNNSVRTLYAVSRIDSGRVIGVAYQAYYKSRDAGVTWNQYLLQDTISLTQVEMQWKTGVGMMTGYDPRNAGVVLRSTDAGETWVRLPMTRITTQPAWVETIEFVLMILSIANIPLIAMLIVARSLVAKQMEEAVEREENALVIMSDVPSDEDKLGFSSTVQSILKLIRNPDSALPITIVLDGQWGSGKSSMMSQIKKALKNDNRFVTVWFNSWHFQSEQHMLTVFLSTMLSAFERSFGPLFRIKLFFNRLFRLPFLNRLVFYTGTFLVVPFIVYLLLQMEPFNQWYNAQNNTFFELIGKVVNHDFSKENYYPVISIISWLVGLFFLGKEWSAGGLSTFLELVPLKKFQMEAAREDPGFREKYKKEFWELMQAAGDNRRYVVFIDDMDRVNGQRLTELFEGVNFISDTASRPERLEGTNANMVFIMGMSTAEVVKNMGKELSKDDAAEDIDYSAVGARFMQKMVDLVVPVPAIANSKKEDLKTLVSRPKKAADLQVKNATIRRA